MSGSDPQVLSQAARDAIERAADELFVGRGRELLQLDAALKDALGGRGRMLLIAGEPGIGKTRLAERITATATKLGADVFWGRCWEGEGAPAFWPWVQIARSYMRGRDAASLASRLGIGAPYVAQVVPEIRELLPDLPAAPPLDSEQSRFRLYDSFATFLTSAAADKPLVIALDDLHWADKSSLLLLQFLAREIVDARLFLLATYRDVEVSAAHPLGDVLPNLRRERAVDRILLRGLPEEEVRTLLVALRGGDVPQSFVANLAHETAGNPFFIKEILRHLLDEGVAYRDGARWEPRLDEKEVRLPESVREVLSRRLARLGESCRKLLTVASVIGREFGLDVLQKASDLESERILDTLEEAATARIVEEVPQAIGRYRFAHELVRETLYGELRTVERVRLQRRVGEALEKLFSKDPEPQLGKLAHHFLEALPGGDVAKAVDYAVRAGDRAGERLAYQEAAILYDRALQALDLADDPDERLRCELLLKLGEAQWSTGGFENPGAVFQAAAESAEKLRAPELVARAALGVGGPGVSFSLPGYQNPHEVAFLERALAVLDETDAPLRARVMARLAGCRARGRAHGGRGPEEAVDMARRAIEMARNTADSQTLGFVLNAIPWASWMADTLHERLALANEAIRVAETLSDRTLAIEAYLWRAGHHLELGDVDAADRDVEAQLRFSAGLRQPYHRYLVALTRAGRAFLEARFEEAESYRLEARAAAIEAWGTAKLDSIATDAGIGPTFQEQRGTTSDEDIARWEDFAERNPIPMFRVRVARMQLSRGRIEEARRHYEVVAANDFSDVTRDLLWLWTIGNLAQLASRFGDVRRAKILYELLLPYADRCAVAGATISGGSMSRGLGLLAATLGRFEEAEKHFEAALGMNTKIRAVIWLAHTQHDYARMLCLRGGAGDRVKAADLVATSLATTRDRGMKPLEEAILATLAETGLATPVERPSATGQLTEVGAAFRKDGEFWTVSYEGKDLRLKDAKGLQYIAYLIRNQGREVHAADLTVGAEGDASGARIDRGDAGEVLDAQARGEYKQRLEDLEAELEEATRWGDSGRAARTQEEIEFLKDELSSAFGLGGRPRTTGSAAERARKSVASRIQDTIAKIRKEHAVLALHFANSIRMGTFCSYAPERSVDWRL